MLGFLIALVAGALTERAEEPLARPLAERLRPHVDVAPGEMRLLAFMLVLLIAGVLAELAHSGTPFWVILGAVLGYFGTRLVEAAKRARG